MLRNASGQLLSAQNASQAIGSCVQYEAVYVDANGNPLHPATDKIVSFSGLSSGNQIFPYAGCSGTKAVVIYGSSGAYPNNYQKAKYFYLRKTAPQSGSIQLKTGSEPRSANLNIQ